MVFIKPMPRKLYVNMRKFYSLFQYPDDTFAENYKEIKFIYDLLHSDDRDNILIAGALMKKYEKE